MKELHLWSEMKHQNILPLLGYLTEGSYPSIISEWMDNGTARSYVINNDVSAANLLPIVCLPAQYSTFVIDIDYNIVSLNC